jgi:hypothetical protein
VELTLFEASARAPVTIIVNLMAFKFIMVFIDGGRGVDDNRWYCRSRNDLTRILDGCPTAQTIVDDCGRSAGKYRQRHWSRE